MITLLVITDGRRDLITETIPSARANLVGPITRRVIYDDSGDDTNRAWLRETFPDFEVIWHPAGRQGFGGAIRTAWSFVGLAAERFVFHLEDDFTFNRPVDLTKMAQILDLVPDLSQIALRRQAWNDAERSAGGVVELNPYAYVGVHWTGDIEAEWLEHRLFFTTNPSLYRTELCRRGWPKGDQSEGRFSAELFTDPHVRCAYWGRHDDDPWVHHNGKERAGVGY